MVPFNLYGFVVTEGGGCEMHQRTEADLSFPDPLDAV
jgi:hypothetical protein